MARCGSARRTAQVPRTTTPLQQRSTVPRQPQLEFHSAWRRPLENQETETELPHPGSRHHLLGLHIACRLAQGHLSSLLASRLDHPAATRSCDIPPHTDSPPTEVLTRAELAPRGTQDIAVVSGNLETWRGFYFRNAARQGLPKNLLTLAASLQCTMPGQDKHKPGEHSGQKYDGRWPGQTGDFLMRIGLYLYGV